MEKDEFEISKILNYEECISRFHLKQAIDTQVVSAQLASDPILADLLHSLVLIPNMV